MLLGYSFEPGPNSRALGTAGSVMTIGLSINGLSHAKNQFDERKQDWLVQRFGLRRLQRFDTIQAEPPSLLLLLRWRLTPGCYKRLRLRYINVPIEKRFIQARDFEWRGIFITTRGHCPLYNAPFRGPNGKVRAENGICSLQHDFMLNSLSLWNKFVRFGLARAQMMQLGPQINYMPDKSHVIMINKLVP